MGDYVLVCVFFSLILACNSWPYETREYNQNHQTHGSRSSDTNSNQTKFYSRMFGPGPQDDPPDGMIVYPGASNAYDAKGKGTNCSDSICDDAIGYPHDHLKSIVPQLRQYRHLFGGVEGSQVDLDSKLGPPDPNEKPLCGSMTHTKFPKTMINEKKVEKFIVNDGDFTQGLVIEKCLEDAVCGDATFPTGFGSKCVQKYSTRRLMVLTKEGGEPAIDTFPYPSCCVCVTFKIKN